MIKKTEIALLGDFFIENIKVDKIYNMDINHYHDMYEIYLQIDGERGLFLDRMGMDCIEYFHLKKGDLVIIEPFVIHCTQSFENMPYERYVTNFMPSSLNGLLNKNEIDLLFKDIHTCVIHLDDELINKIYSYFDRMEKYSKKQGILAKKMMFAEVFQFLVLIGEVSRENKISKSNLVPNEIVKAMNYVKEHYEKNITLEFIVDYVHMSKSRFCHKFNELTGTSFIEYLYSVRITMVSKLLLETQLPLHKIAEQTGFTSTAHMARVFKKIHNMSPSKFRK